MAKALIADYAIRIADTEDFSAVQRVTIHFDKSLGTRQDEVIKETIRKHHRPQVELGRNDIKILETRVENVATPEKD